VTFVILCKQALPERVAFGSLSTELGDVKIYLKAWEGNGDNCIEEIEVKHTARSSELQKSPFQGL
jgi:hypothetical protein